MTTHSTFTALALEPNTMLMTPYMHLPQNCELRLLNNSDQMIAEISKQVPDLILLSASVAPEHVLKVLWLLKDLSTTKLIPVIFVVDWSQSVIRLPGTSWGGKVGLLHSLSVREEVDATMSRVMH